MENVPLKILKARMAYFFELAARGQTLEVTKHNKPYVYVASSASPYLHPGKLVGQTSLSIGKKIHLKKSVSRLLNEDRDENV